MAPLLPHSQMSSRITVVEDDAFLADLLVQRLRAAGFAADFVSNGLAALSVIRSQMPDIVLLDIEMPDMDGLEICRRLKREPETARIGVIIVSARSEVVDRVVGLEIGADDYVVKPFEPREVIARVHSVLRRLQQPPAPPRRIGGLEIDFDTHITLVGGARIELTFREFSLLRALIAANGRIIRRSTLLQEAWGLEHGDEIDSRTVDVHVARLRQKLGSEAERLLTVKGAGYRFDVTSPS
jgi:DNA-binding response OmpR family regulator